MQEAIITGGIEIPYTPENLRKSKQYNYIKTDDTIYFGVRQKDKKVLLLPRDITKFKKIFTDYPFKYHTITPKVDKKVKLAGLSLRDYQQKPADSVASFWENGRYDVILQAETGWGKSYVVSYFIEKLQLKTTIIVDKTLLAQQMFDEISQNSDADVRILKKGSELGDVNITTYQLLSKNPVLLDKLVKTTGLLIADEVHIVAATTIVQITNQFPAKYRLGLSATPTRSDGLTELIKDLFGRAVVVADNPNALIVQVHRVNCAEDIFYSGAKDYKKKLHYFLGSKTYKITNLCEALLSKGRKLCIACDIQKTQDLYKAELEKIGISASVLNSKASKSDREKILKDYNDEKIDVIIGFAVLEKGISIPRMDTIIHLSGAGTKEKVTQLIGRLKRDDKRKKSPIFIDLMFGGNLEKQVNVRHYAYYGSLQRKISIKNISSFVNYMEAVRK